MGFASILVVHKPAVAAAFHRGMALTAAAASPSPATCKRGATAYAPPTLPGLTPTPRCARGVARSSTSPSWSPWMQPTDLPCRYTLGPEDIGSSLDLLQVPLMGA